MQVSRKAAPLLTSKAQYRVLYGGRSSGKSWFVAQMLVMAAMEGKKRILCAREYQNSIGESAKELITERIDKLGFSDQFTVQNTTIKCKTTGSEFLFWGLRTNPRSIRSLEGIDICWIEEAQTISKTSWDELEPTIRKPGSYFYVTLNPELEIDESYQRFIVHPPEDSTVIEMNWRHNPWFSKESEKQRRAHADRDPVGYKTIWEGQCRQAVEGSIYGDVLETAREEGRITSVPVDVALPVHTGWDLGVLDSTAIWFFQVTRGGEIHWIDYHEDAGPGLDSYARVLSDKGYTYGTHYAPHDIKARELGSGKSRLEVAAGFGIKFFVVRRIGSGHVPEAEAGIAAVRDASGRMWWDQLRCKVGLQMLSRYRRGFNQALNEFRPGPVHDSASHCADAKRTAIVGYAPARVAERTNHEDSMPTGPSGWMV